MMILCVLCCVLFIKDDDPNWSGWGLPEDGDWDDYDKQQLINENQQEIRDYDTEHDDSDNDINAIADADAEDYDSEYDSEYDSAADHYYDGSDSHDHDDDTDNASQQTKVMDLDDYDGGKQHSTA
jgi:hypothetical protein